MYKGQTMKTIILDVGLAVAIGLALAALVLDFFNVLSM
jgi:hypothetical protein